MARWHERRTAKIGLRIAGLLLLASAWAEATLLNDLVRDHSAQDASVSEFLLAAVMFASASAGAALTILGSALWEPVPLSARWARRAPEHPRPVSPSRKEFPISH